jgi:hypothetical protein
MACRLPCSAPVLQWAGASVAREELCSAGPSPGTRRVSGSRRFVIERDARHCECPVRLPVGRRGSRRPQLTRRVGVPGDRC